MIMAEAQTNALKLPRISKRIHKEPDHKLRFKHDQHLRTKFRPSIQAQKYPQMIQKIIKKKTIPSLTDITQCIQILGNSSLLTRCDSINFADVHKLANDQIDQLKEIFKISDEDKLRSLYDKQTQKPCSNNKIKIKVLMKKPEQETNNHSSNESQSYTSSMEEINTMFDTRRATTSSTINLCLPKEMDYFYHENHDFLNKPDNEIFGNQDCLEDYNIFEQFQGLDQQSQEILNFFEENERC